MKVKNMTLSQCKRIIDAGFVGEHKNSGKQTDYHDYRDEILAHYWNLSDKAIQSMSVYPSVTFEIDRCEVTIAVLRAFNPWRELSNRIEMKMF